MAAMLQLSESAGHALSLSKHSLLLKLLPRSAADVVGAIDQLLPCSRSKDPYTNFPTLKPHTFEIQSRCSLRAHASKLAHDNRLLQR
jgi:hypothetical protein